MTVSLDGELCVDLPHKDLCVFVDASMEIAKTKCLMDHLVTWAGRNPQKHCTMVFMPGVTRDISEYFSEIDPLWQDQKYRERFASKGAYTPDDEKVTKDSQRMDSIELTLTLTIIHR